MTKKEYFANYRGNHKNRLAQTRRMRYYKNKHNISCKSIIDLKEDCGWTEYDELFLKAYLSRADIKRKIFSIGENLVVKEYLQNKIQPHRHK